MMRFQLEEELLCRIKPLLSGTWLKSYTHGRQRGHSHFEGVVCPQLQNTSMQSGGGQTAALISRDSSKGAATASSATEARTVRAASVNFMA